MLAATSERKWCQMKRTIWKVISRLIYCIKSANKRRRNLHKFSFRLALWPYNPPTRGDFNFSSHKKSINCGLSTCTQLKGNTVNLVSFAWRVHSVNFSNFSPRQTHKGRCEELRNKFSLPGLEFFFSLDEGWRFYKLTHKSEHYGEKRCDIEFG